MEHGHPNAAEYPIRKVWEEAALVAERVNRLEATRAVLLQMAVSSLFSKEAGDGFRKVLSELNDGE